MGSYLSILNNTSDVWCVKVGPDEAAIDIASITSSVLVAVAATVATAGAAAPVAASLAANGIVSVFGVDAAFLEAATAAAAAVSGETGAVSTAAKFTIKLVGLIEDKLSSEGFDRLNPGETKRYGKMTLSLWQQCTCIRTRVNPANPEQILVERVFMRPIFSGATDNSNLTHDIQFWINKFGIEHLNTITGA